MPSESSSDEWEDAVETPVASSHETVGMRETDSDGDLTPRPLRVVKMKRDEPTTQTSSTPCNKSSIRPRVRKCQTQCTMTPYQRTSSLIDGTNLDRARRASYSPTCPPKCPPKCPPVDRESECEGDDSSLTVRKVRGGKAAKLQASSAPETHSHPPCPPTTGMADVDPTHPGPAPAAAAVASFPAPAAAHDAMSAHKAETRRAVQGPMACAGHHSQTPGCAISTSTASLSSRSRAHGARRSSSRTLYPQARETRRSVTASERVHHDTVPGRNETVAAPNRQSSLKHRFLNRMMVGLVHKPFPDRPPHEETKMAEAWPLTGQTGGELALLRKSSSVYSDELSELDQTLSVFPSPPTSTVTTPTTVGSFDGNDIPSLAHRNLSIPSRAATVGAELSLMSDYDEYKSNTGVSMAIEIAAVINDFGIKSRTGDEANALDVAMVIDNS